MNYGTYDQLINPEIKEALESRGHPLGNNNAYPEVSDRLTNGNFEQQCAKKRIDDVVTKYREATSTTELSTPEFFKYLAENMMTHLFQGVKMSCQLEADHIEELEKLAVNIVRKDFNIREGDVIFNVKITGFGKVKFPPEMKLDKEDMMEPPEINEANFEYDVDDEVQKREFINALISGASKKGHYIFHLGREELDAINKNLVPLYQLSMSANDISYYMIGESHLNFAMGGEGDNTHAGYEKLSFTEDGIPIITVEAVNFPSLLHEIIKGVLELIATLALPDDKPMVNYLYDMADYVKAELWYLRLGPIFWERLTACLPAEHAPLKSQLLGKLFELETDEFNALMRSALSEDNQAAAKKFFSDWGRIIRENIREYNQRQS
jgi:hypothetical protein